MIDDSNKFVSPVQIYCLVFFEQLQSMSSITKSHHIPSLF